MWDRGESLDRFAVRELTVDAGGGGQRLGRDPYLIPGTDVLENKLGIRDPRELERAERLLTADRLVELAREPVAGNFDLAHLQRIHRAIFQDVYEWAGDLREIDISKGAMRFATTSQLESSGAEIFRRLARNNHFQDLSHGDFVKSAADYLADVNALHPFREGNGRTQREFFRELAARAGFHLDWSRTDSREVVRASIAGMVGDTKPLVRILRRASASPSELGGIVRDDGPRDHERREASVSRPTEARNR